MADTRNKAWADDKSKFGYRMLEKMGWSEGKGLGKNEDGVQNHIRVKRRRTQAGIGGNVSKTQEQWKVTGEVATSFNDVLARIGGGVDADDDVKSGKSDSDEEETTSKNESTPSSPVAPTTKKRSAQSYFSRRSRQKNVRTYSEADLREIFGGVSLPDIPKAAKTEQVAKILSENPCDGRVTKKKKAKKDKKSKKKSLKPGKQLVLHVK